MTDTQNAEMYSAIQNKQLSIKKIYVKDVSFESPKIPGTTPEKWKPNLDIQLHSSSTKINKNSFYEVVLQITLKATDEQQTVFLVEVAQAGLFEIANTENSKDINAILQVHCPSILFPFARETVASLITKGGFPQLLIGPINFDAIYSQKLQALQSEKQHHGKPH